MHGFSSIFTDIAWDQVGLGVGALAALVYVVRSVRGIFSTTMTFMGNHLSHLAGQMEASTRATEAVARATEHMADRLERVEDELKEARHAQAGFRE